MPNGAQPYHLLWGLMFMKLYCAEAVNASMAGGVDVKTFRKWSWLFAEAIAVLHYSVVGVFLAIVCMLVQISSRQNDQISLSFFYYLFYFRFCGRIGSQASLAIPVLSLSMAQISKSTNQIPSGRVGGRTNSTGQAFGMKLQYAS